MTITFPRELPAVGFVTADVTLREPVASVASGGGRMNHTQIGDPAWEASLVTAPLLYSEFAEVEAWWLSLREGLRRVLFRHPHVCFPKNHGSNQAPANQAGAVVSVANGNEVTVGGVAAGLSLVIGDRVGLERTGRCHVGRVVEVSGSGASRVIALEPPPPDSLRQSGTVVRFARPALLMRPVSGSFAAPRNGRHYTVSFKLVDSL